MAEACVMLHVERLPEGGVLATSEAIQSLVAQGRTVSETLEIARDVARRLMEAQQERQQGNRLDAVSENFDYPLIVNTEPNRITFSGVKWATSRSVKASSASR